MKIIIYFFATNSLIPSTFFRSCKLAPSIDLAEPKWFNSDFFLVFPIPGISSNNDF